MKKVLLTLAAVATLAGCTTEVVMDTTKEAIAFENSFIDNATKAAYDGSYNNSVNTPNELTQFEVYATITGEEGNTANIFRQELVQKGSALGQGTNWSYAAANTQYWIPGNDYVFRAVVDGNVENVSEVAANTYGLATSVNLLDASAQKDILVAEETVAYTSGAHTVRFTFNHILAKAKFTVKNTIATNNGYSYKVYDLKINDIAKNGVYTYGEGWTAAAAPATYNLAFGHAVTEGTAAGAEVANIAYNSQVESNYDRLLIPTVGEALNITFKYELLKDGVIIDTQNKTIETAPLKLEAGKAYNLVFSLGNPGEPIQFDVVEVTDWVEAVDPVNVIGGEIENQTLMSNVEATSKVTLNGYLDGAGYTMSALENVDYVISGTARLIDAKAGSTIKNLVIDGNDVVYNSYGIRGIYTTGNGDVKVDNVQIYDCTYAINANNNGTIYVTNSILQGWNSYGSTTEAYFENVRFIDGTYHNFRPYASTVCKNCDFGEGVVIDLSHMIDGTTIKFENCTVAGKPLTSGALSAGDGKNVSVDLTVTEAPVSNGLVANTSVKDMTIDGGDFDTTDGKGLRGVYITKGGEYNIENAVIKNVTYAINVNTTAAVTLNVSNSTLEGWTSYGSSTAATFNKVAFTCGKYANYRPYSSTTLIDCSFEEGFCIDFTALTGVLTFKNCTYNGTVLTTANFAEVAKTEGDFTGKIDF